MQSKQSITHFFRVQFHGSLTGNVERLVVYNLGTTAMEAFWCVSFSQPIRILFSSAGLEMTEIKHGVKDLDHFHLGSAQLAC